MKGNILLLIAIIVSLSSVNCECTTDCANGYKIIMDVYYCKGIFGEPQCGNDANCSSDYAKYNLCAYSGCFGDLTNLSSINDFNKCLNKCEGTTDAVKKHAKGMNNCMDVANSQILMYSLFLLISSFLLI